MPVKILLLAMNLAVFATLGGLAYFLKWSGPGFCVGVIAGGFAVASIIRLRLGYWP